MSRFWLKEDTLLPALSQDDNDHKRSVSKANQLDFAYR
jgi:hypothetical protein